jgi:tetratricopeptide repeat protein 30
MLTDTWFCAKRCFLSLAEGLAKHMIPFKDASWQEVLTFLQDIEKVGKAIPAAFAGAGAAGAGVGGGAQRRLSSEGATVASEARQLRGMFLKLQQMA